MKSKENKFLIVKDNVKLNDKLDAAIVKFDKVFEKANHKAYVTSGIRTAEDQLRIIKDYCTRKGIKDDFIKDAKVDSKVQYDNEEIYSWQLAWSKLLNAGIIINPPIKAKLLLSYIGKNGKERKGDYFNPSPHFFERSFDIGGGADSIENEKDIVIEAIKKGELAMVKSFVVERQNNCLHIDII